MSLMTETEFEAFFEPYARNVEGFYEAAYWRLCDEIIQTLIRRHLRIKPGDHLVDAGGGTGRWAIWCAQALGTKVTVADLSQNMLRQARENVRAAGAENLVTTVHCDIQDAPQLEDTSFDGAISIYNMLSFLDEPGRAFETLARVLKPGARGFIMGQSYVNAIASKFNRDVASSDDIRALAETRIVKWAPHVPQLRMFSSQELQELASAAGLVTEGLYGITVLIAPGPEDFTYPYKQMSGISQALENPDYYKAALDLELAFNGQPAFVERGVNLAISVLKL